MACHSELDGGASFYNYTTSSGQSSVCYFGFPGKQVWAVVNGVRAENLTWFGDAASAAPTPESVPTSPAPVPAPAIAVTVSRGASAQGKPGCSSSACAFVTVTLTTSRAVRTRWPATPNLMAAPPSTTTRPSPGQSSVCYFRFPGKQVWAVVDGVRSENLTW